jgi:hypothetical protein
MSIFILTLTDYTDITDSFIPFFYLIAKAI